MSYHPVKARFSTRFYIYIAVLSALSVSQMLATQPVPASGILAWGDNANGQLGNASNADSSFPVQTQNLTGVTAIAAGFYHSLALTGDGNVWAWGQNADGQLGNGTNTDSSVPVQVSGITGTVTAIAAGYYHSLALTSDGKVWAWGLNSTGQLGDNTQINRNAAVQVTGLSNVVVTAISGGGYHCLALTSDGHVWAWGFNGSGQLGNGTNTDSHVPVQVSNLTNFTGIAGGNNHTLALTGDGTVWAWGYNANGQLGNGTNTDSNVPVQVSNLSGVAKVASGLSHGLALTNAGQIWTWGWNNQGQLGNDSNTDSNVPVQVAGLVNVTAIAGGALHSLAVTSAGVFAWGFNNHGQLGNSSTTASSFPVQVGTLSNATLVAGGAFHSLAYIPPPSPLLSINKSHTGNFTQGATATWTIQVSNTGTGATEGSAVTVQDNLPTGYTLASYTGTDWSCSGTTIVTCTNSDIVAGTNTNFTALKITANVPGNAASICLNNVLVYGGGDLVHKDATTAAKNSDLAVVQGFQVTVGTNPSLPLLYFYADGSNYNSPQTFTWSTGTQHLLFVAQTQSAGAGIQYYFTGWSDGAGTVDALVATAATTSYTANYKLQYLLTTAAGTGGTVLPGSAYYDAGTVVPISASPAPNYKFTSWTGPVASASSASTTVTMSGPVSITANFVGSNAASYISPADTAHKGNWTGNFGADGYIIANDANLPPSYAKVTLGNDSIWTWALPTTDSRALQTSPGATTRIASTFYSTTTSFNINVNMTDGNAHRISLYLLDWDTTARAQTISILDANTQAVLDTETFASFQTGEYASWTVSGNIVIQVTRNAGYNSVVAGIFFDPTNSTPAPPPPPPPPTTGATASYAGPDAATQGNWTPTYGADGDYIANYAANNPNYATVNLTGQSLWTWANPTSDPRALRTTGSHGIASTYYGSTFSINVNLTDGNKHRVALYLLDWDTAARAETIQILDASNNAVLDTEKFSNFHNGVYAVWDIKGNVIIQVTGTAGYNGVVAGIFFGPASAPVTSVNTATYTGSDATTEGTWTGHYGSSGALIVGGTNTLPSYAKTTLTGNATWTFASSTTDPRALQIASGSSSQTAAVYYSTASNFSINLNLADGKAHKVSLYLLDWDTTARAETVTILDAASNTVLNTQSFSAFHNGEYASWTITGNVIIQVAKTAGINAVISGLFID